MENAPKNDLSVQSNNFTMSKIAFHNIYEKRIAYAIVDSVSPYLKNELEKKKKGKEISYEPGMFDIDKITYRARDLEPHHQHYSMLRKALKDLRERTIDIETEDDHIGTAFVLKYKFKKNTETVEISIDKELFHFLRDLTKGHTLLQMKTAISLESPYAMKIYELICKWRDKKRFYMSLEDVRFITNTVDKYKQIGQLKEKVLDKAKKILEKNELTDVRFKYKDRKSGRRVIGFWFYPNLTENAYEERRNKNQVSSRFFISKSVIKALNNKGIEMKGRTKEIIEQWGKKNKHDEGILLADLARFNEEVKKYKPENEAGYIISRIKKQL